MKLLLLCVFLTFALACTETCDYSSNKDIQDNDYYNVQGRSQSQCCQLCYDSYYCKAVSWTGYNGGTCWLKSATGPIIDRQDVNVAVLTRATCQSSANFDIDGSDLTSVSGQSEDKCCDLCSQTQGCKAYAYNSFQGGTCWLKSATGPILSKSSTNVGVVCSGSSCSEAGSVGCPAGWKKFKQYDFSSLSQINADWEIKRWDPGHVNNELQKYTNSTNNIFIRNNNLVIKAIKTNGQLTSGRLQSKQLYTPNIVPGNKLKIEFTATVPAAMGSWPALWMCGVNGEYGPTWPHNGEIDVMEWVYQLRNNVKSSIHWKSGNDWSGDFTNRVNVRELSSSFITYGVEYSTVRGNEYIQFYIRKPTGEVFTVNKAYPSDWESTFNGNCKPNCPPMAPFDAKMQLILNVAIGGDWGGCCGVQGYNIFDSGVEMEISAVNVCVVA